jgi:hypothetical protein
MSILSDESRPLLEVPRLEGARGFESSPNLSPAAKEAATYRLLAVTWVAVATVLRFAAVARLPLANGEAYYAAWSRFLSWSYYDHPPLVAWMVRTTTLLGTSSAAVRLGPVLCAGAFGLLFYKLAERFFGPRAAFVSLVLLTAVPVFLVSSFVLNPEAPLAPLWVGYLLVLEGMRERDDAYRPLVAGALLGAAFLAKYTAVLLVPTTFVYLAFSAPARRWLRRPSLYLGGVVALAIAMPVLLWNQAHGWPTLQLHFVERAHVEAPVAGENAINHLMEDASPSGSGTVQSLLRLLFGQFLSYSPLLAPLFVVALVRTVRGARKDDRDLFLASFSVPALFLMLAAMVRVKDAEQHWTMVAMIPAVIAAGRYAEEAWTSTRRLSWLAAAGVATSGVLFAAGVVHAHSNAIINVLPPAHYDSRADLTSEFHGWDQVRASVAQAVHDARSERGETASSEVVLASNHYAMCGRLLMETGDSPRVFCPQARRSAFDFFDRRDPPADATVVVVTTDIHADLPPGLAARSCTLSDDVPVERAGRTVARYFVHTCAPEGARSSAPRAENSAPESPERRAARD